LSTARQESRDFPIWREYFDQTRIVVDTYTQLSDIFSDLEAGRWKSAKEKLIPLHNSIETAVCPEEFMETAEGGRVEMLTKEQLYTLVYLVSAIVYRPSGTLS
jgi:hypothetical protein